MPMAFCWDSPKTVKKGDGGERRNAIEQEETPQAGGQTAAAT